MPVARIVTQAPQQSPEIQQISEQLRAQGYEVLISASRSAAAADLLIEIDELSVAQALDAAVRLARESNTDVYIAPGLFAAAEPAGTNSSEIRPPLPQTSADRNESAPNQQARSERSEQPQHSSVLRSTLAELGGALEDGRTGIRDTVSGWRQRAAEAWTELQRTSAAAARERSLERERRALEREQRRQEHQLALQRQAEEKQRMLAEQERAAAERERAHREQMARDADVRAEREQREREQMAREAARRADIARAEEQQRIAAREAERLRIAHEQETALAAIARQEPIQPAAESAPAPVEAAAPVAAREHTPRPTPPPGMRRPYRPRRAASSRERQWQRAAFIAAVATLAAMLGFAIAANFTPSAPIPQAVQQNRAEQQVPFGPARMDVSPGGRAAHGTTPAAAQVGPASRKPSASRPAVPRRRGDSSSDVAEDEVIVHHLPTSRAQRAQAKQAAPTGGVRRFSDEN